MPPYDFLFFKWGKSYVWGGGGVGPGQKSYVIVERTIRDVWIRLEGIRVERISSTYFYIGKEGGRKRRRKFLQENSIELPHSNSISFSNFRSFHIEERHRKLNSDKRVVAPV